MTISIGVLAVLLKSYSFLIVIFLSFPVLALDEALFKTVKFINRGLQSKGPSANKCSKNLERDCPEVLRKSFKDIYREGRAGTINDIISDGSLKNPRTVCHSSSHHAHKLNQKKLSEQLQSNYKALPQLHDYTQRCSEKVSHLIDGEYKEDVELASSYMQYDFNYKSMALQTAMTNLLDSNAQIGLIIPEAKMNCKELRFHSIRLHCEKLQKCRPQGNKQHYLDIKSEEVSKAIDVLSTLSVERNKMMTSIPRGDHKVVIQIKQEMESIMDLNPLLKGEKFKKILKELRSLSYLNQKMRPKKSEVDNAIKEQLKISQNEIRKHLNEFNLAHGCLTGDRRECGDFTATMKKIQYSHPIASFPKADELNSIAIFHSCIENVKDSRNTADAVLNNTTLNLALMLTPYALINGAKLITTLGRTAGISSKVIRNANMAARGIVVGGLAYGAYATIDEYNECQKEIRNFQNMGINPGQMTCENMDKIFVNNSNSSQCISQALLSALLMSTTIPSKIKLAKEYPFTSL